MAGAHIRDAPKRARAASTHSGRAVFHQSDVHRCPSRVVAAMTKYLLLCVGTGVLVQCSEAAPDSPHSATNISVDSALAREQPDSLRNEITRSLRLASAT